VRNARNERFPPILVQPRIIGTGGIGLYVVEARNGREGESGTEERPNIAGLDAIRVGLVLIYFEEWPSCSERRSKVSSLEELAIGRDAF
jgi:hypothetical protein